MKEAPTTYRDNGFYVSKRPVIPPDIVQAALKGMEAVRRGHYDTGFPPADPSWTPEEGNDVLCRISMPHFASRAVRDLITHTALAGFVAEVTDSKVLQAWWSVYFSKPPATSAESSGKTPGKTAGKTSVGAHQDFSYWTEVWGHSDGLFTAWIALNEVKENSGPVYYLAKSHKNGLGKHNFFFEGNLDKQIEMVRKTHKGEWREEPALLPAGGVSIHHGLTYHWSGSNTSSEPRIGLAIHFRSEKSRPLKKERKTRYIDQFDKCPVVYGSASLIRDFTS